MRGRGARLPKQEAYIKGAHADGCKRFARQHERAIRRAARGLARAASGGDHRSLTADRRSPSPSLESRAPLSDRGDGGRYRLRPQRHRHRLCRLPLDVSRARAGGVPAGGRSRVRQWRRRDERQRRLRQGRDLRRHRQPRQSAARRCRTTRVGGRDRGGQRSLPRHPAFLGLGPGSCCRRHVCEPAAGIAAGPDLPQGLCLPRAAQP